MYRLMVRLLSTIAMAMILSLGLVSCGGGDGGETNLALTSPGSGSTASGFDVAYTQPYNGQISVSTDARIIVQFNEPVDATSLDPNRIEIVGPGGVTVGYTYTVENDIVRIAPSSTLQEAVSYTIRIDRSVSSLQGEAMSRDVIVQFSTASRTDYPPLYGRWLDSMDRYGRKWGEYIADPANAGDYALLATYYDAERVFYQIADFTGNSDPWYRYAAAAEKVYRDDYAIANNYLIPGYWRFAAGIYLDYLKTGDTVSYEGIRLIRDNPAFSNADTYARADTAWYWQVYSREIAYSLDSHVWAERAGYPRDQVRVDKYVAMALNHIQEWLTQNYANPNTDEHRLAPFMFGLTAEALIHYYEWEVEQGHPIDETIPNAIKAMADYLWEQATVQSGTQAGKPMWIPDIGGTPGAWNDQGGTGYGAFRYEDKNAARPAPDLNLLIAPVYAWLFNHFGDIKYIERGDLIWSGGVALAAIDWSGKQYNQSYRWSIDYVKWRQAGYLRLK